MCARPTSWRDASDVCVCVCVLFVVLILLVVAGLHQHLVVDGQRLLHGERVEPRRLEQRDNRIIGGQEVRVAEVVNVESAEALTPP